MVAFAQPATFALVSLKVEAACGFVLALFASTPDVRLPAIGALQQGMPESMGAFKTAALRCPTSDTQAYDGRITSSDQQQTAQVN